MDLDFININDFSDAELANRMRSNNYEKFKSLVRMHLSFELDLNTDEFDLPCHEIVYEDKGKLKKWNRLSNKHKHGSSGLGVTTGCGGSSSKSTTNSPTDGVHQQIDAGFLLHMEELKQFLLLEKNITQEGIYRKTGSLSRQNELRLHIQNDKPLHMEHAGYTAHDCATVFKGFLADLPEPLLTDAHYPAHLQIAPLCMSSASNPTKPLNPEREQHLLSSLQLLLLLLPQENRQLLQHVIEMLNTTAKHEAVNKMSAYNLSLMFAPHLICPRNLPPEAIRYITQKMSSIIVYMIVKGVDIFDVPAKLSTDIRAHFLERKRKKTMSPEQTLDESISDISTVNTVYTFVDRERTAAATNSNTTDTELAQLYAHIQSLPESSKKRRLIKQFNKQNGQGTPLQFVVMNRLKNSETRSAKSLGDSIKKHIFHKSLMSRTPKRQTTPVGVETPNYSNAKNPKLRVLFHSPTPGPSTPTALTEQACASVSTVASTNRVPHNIETHPLQKSMSSSSLRVIKSKSPIVAEKGAIINQNEHYENCTNSSSISSGSQNSRSVISAPVTRQNSNDSTLSAKVLNLPDYDPNCCKTPLKIISAAAKQIIAGDKKTVAWDENHLLDVEEYSNPCTPVEQTSAIGGGASSGVAAGGAGGSDLKSRYKSEPNLSRVHCEKITHGARGELLTPISKTSGKSFTRKLIKGVSMSNLKFPFSTPESTKRLVRSVSATLKRRPSDDTHHVACIGGIAVNGGAAVNSPLLEDVDDVELEEDVDGGDEVDVRVKHVDIVDNNDDNGDDDDDETIADDVNLVVNENDDYGGGGGGGGDDGSSSSELRSCGSTYQHMLLNQHHSGLYRNLNLITSTPSLHLGRRSMSPITKSTQRMPKSMQESIMTPRSRKPVMVLTTTHGSSDQNQTLSRNDLSSFREQDEDTSCPLIGSAKQLEPPHLHSEDATSVGSYADIIRRQQLQQSNQSFVPQTNHLTALATNPMCDSTISGKKTITTAARDDADASTAIDGNALSENFKEYLLTRSVQTSSPVDSSFSSQPDDFGGAGSSTQELEDLEESQLSTSLLYCLNGNAPQNIVNVSPSSSSSSSHIVDAAGVDSPCVIHAANIGGYLLSNPFVILNNARKRAATTDLNKPTANAATAAIAGTSSMTDGDAKAEEEHSEANKENMQHADGYMLTKKLLITDYPGETSF